MNVNEYLFSNSVVSGKLNMKVTELNNAPTSGLYDEKHFGSADTHSLWLKLDDKDGSSFILSFSGGDMKLQNNKTLLNGDTLSVLFNGAFYSVDLSTKNIIFNPDDYYYVDFIYSEDNSLLCLGTFWGVEIFKEQKLIKDLRPELIDGVKFESATKNKITGKLYNVGDDWRDFSIDLETLWLESMGMTFRL